jgi:phosphate transport system permease protein
MADSTLPSTDRLGGLARSSKAPRNVIGAVMTALTVLCLAITFVFLFTVVFYVVSKGLELLRPNVFVQLIPPAGVSEGGIGNALQGTLIMLGIASLISIPIGVLASVYLHEFAAGGRFVYAVRFGANVLSGVPSIVVGIFAYGVLVLTLGTFSAVSGGFALAILMLPVIIRATEEALILVPDGVRQAAVALGATRFQTVAQVVLPAALPSIVTGVILALARASGETAPLLFTALFSQYWFQGLFKPTASLAVLIYNYAIIPFEYQQKLAWTGALVLIVLVILASILARLVIRQRKM